MPCHCLPLGSSTKKKKKKKFHITYVPFPLSETVMVHRDENTSPKLEGVMLRQAPLVPNRKPSSPIKITIHRRPSRQFQLCIYTPKHAAIVSKCTSLYSAAVKVVLSYVFCASRRVGSASCSGAFGSWGSTNWSIGIGSDNSKPMPTADDSPNMYHCKYEKDGCKYDSCYVGRHIAVKVLATRHLESSMEKR